jgi:antitoxin ParD1/3/4
MGNIRKRTFSLPTEHMAYIDKKVSSGAYATASEVVHAGLRALQERDGAIERWFKNEVGPTYDALKAGTENVHSAKSVFAEVRARYAGQRKSRR